MQRAGKLPILRIPPPLATKKGETEVSPLATRLYPQAPQRCSSARSSQPYATPSQTWMTGSQPPIKTMTIKIGST